jgi:hypothetical protein
VDERGQRLNSNADITFQAREALVLLVETLGDCGLAPLVSIRRQEGCDGGLGDQRLRLLAPRRIGRERLCASRFGRGSARAGGRPGHGCAQPSVQGPTRPAIAPSPSPTRMSRDQTAHSANLCRSSTGRAANGPGESGRRNRSNRVAVALLDLGRMQRSAPGHRVSSAATRIRDAKLVSQMTRNAHRDGGRLIQERAQETHRAELDGEPEPHVIPRLAPTSSRSASSRDGRRCSRQP